MSEQVGLDIVPEHARELAMSGVALRDLIARAESAIYPDIPALSGFGLCDVSPVRCRWSVAHLHYFAAWSSR